MIAWLQPAALWGLLLVAAPVVIHLLRARHAPRYPFPSIRFIRPAPVASVRLGRPSDLALLAVRAGIIGVAAIAFAQPLIVSNTRLREWNHDVARAVVVDSSASMRRRGASGRSGLALADEVAAQEVQNAAAAERFDASDLAEGLQRARAWLRTAPPARRELVVVSDFQMGSLSDRDLSMLALDIGVRFVQIGESPVHRQLDPQPVLSEPAAPARAIETRVSPDGTRVTVLDAGVMAQGGLRIVGGTGGRDHEAILSAVARAGAPAPSGEQPLALQFHPHAPATEAAPLRERWMLRTLLRLARDPELTRLSRRTEAVATASSHAWTTVLSDRQGRPLVRAASLDRELLLHVAAPASSYVAAAALRGALIARAGSAERPEEEVLAIDPATLQSWRRDPGPVVSDAWRNARHSDARWCWAIALLLLGLEQWLRTRKATRQEEYRAAA